MRKNFFKLTCILALSILPISTLFADQTFDVKKDKIFVVKVTSKDSKYPVNFAGEMLQMSVNGPIATQVNQVTPFEGVVRTNFLNLMLHTISNNSPKIKVEIIDRTDDQEDILVSGTGNAVFIHESASGDGYVNSL